MRRTSWWSLRLYASNPRALKLGLRQEKMSDGVWPFNRVLISASEKGSLKKSLSSNSRPFCERNSLALRHWVQRLHQYNVIVLAMGTSLK